MAPKKPYDLLLFFCIIVVLPFSSCNEKKKVITKNPYTLKVKYVSPDAVIENKKLKFFEYVFFVTYSDKYEAFEMPYHLTKEVDNILVYDSIKYNTLVLIKNDTTGYYFREQNSLTYNNINADSLLKARAMGGSVKHNLFENSLIIREIKKTELSKDELVAKYYFNEGMYDSAYLYFTKKLEQIQFSLSKYFDSCYNSKLYKIRLCIKMEKDKGVPRSFYENIFEISIDKSRNINEIEKRYNAIVNKHNH